MTRVAGSEGQHPRLCPRQLHVFDAPDRDDRGWVLSVAHIAVVPLERLSTRLTENTRLMPVDAPGRLIYDHPDIIAWRSTTSARYAAAPDPDGLLADEFTLQELRLVHEAVKGKAVQRDTFRRAMETQLEPTGTWWSRAEPASRIVPGSPSDVTDLSAPAAILKSASRDAFSKLRLEARQPHAAGGSDDEVADVNRRRREHLRFGGFQRDCIASVSN